MSWRGSDNDQLTAIDIPERRGITLTVRRERFRGSGSHIDERVMIDDTTVLRVARFAAVGGIRLRLMVVQVARVASHTVQRKQRTYQPSHHGWTKVRLMGGELLILVDRTSRSVGGRIHVDERGLLLDVRIEGPNVVRLSCPAVVLVLYPIPQARADQSGAFFALRD